MKGCRHIDSGDFENVDPTGTTRLRWYPSDPPLPERSRSALEKVLLGHEPFPALITDSLWNIVALNHTMQSLIGDVVGHLLAPPANFLRIVLHPEGLAPSLTDPELARSHILRLLRWRATASDGRLRRLEADLRGYPVSAGENPLPTDTTPPLCPPVGLWWQGHRLNFLHVVMSFGGRPGDLSPHLGHGSLEGIALESFLPADAATRALLDSRSRPGRAAPARSHPLSARPTNGMHTTKGSHHDVTPDR
ncbi:hypothetical protein ABT330_37585 [Streptomyces sp. NPDC000658]|uniref:MmyB family transcriptional regulator n=1 Tax=Streptomyces sp. NPDC000658 TaxID=3154266 RepID=UPI00331FA58A